MIAWLLNSTFIVEIFTDVYLRSTTTKGQIFFTMDIESSCRRIIKFQSVPVQRCSIYRIGYMKNFIKRTTTPMGMQLY